MRSNPLYYLTDEQLRVLARMERMTVPEVLAKYDRIRPLSSRPRSAAAKVGESRKAARANPIHYLTDAQLKALALSERTTVAGVLAKYDRIRPISARAAAKGGGSRKAVANPSYSLPRAQAREVMAKHAGKMTAAERARYDLLGFVEDRWAGWQKTVYVVQHRGVVLGVYTDLADAKNQTRINVGATYQTAELFGR